jgi:hypothetical protein
MILSIWWLLQNCVGFVKDEPGSFSETCVTYDDDDGGSEEVDIIFEEAIDITEENVSEAVEFSLMKAEHEVRIGVGVWPCLCVCVRAERRGVYGGGSSCCLDYLVPQKEEF